MLNIDTNRNGILDIAEIEALNQTLENGTYIFTRLESGNHHVRVAPDPIGPLERNETVITLNFRGSVSGFKWNDLNGNGLWEANEPGVGGVRIYADLDSNGIFTEDEPSTFTAADGSYRLLLPTGVFVIREVTPPGTIQTFPFAGNVVPVINAPLVSGEAVAETWVVAGNAFHNGKNPADVNGDGAVTVYDALGVVRELRHSGIRSLDGEGESGVLTSQETLYIDVNNDRMLSVSDLWGVINALRGEGEPIARDDAPGQQSPDPFRVVANMQHTLPVLDNDDGDGQLTIVGLGTLEQGIVGVTATGDRGGQLSIAPGGGAVLYQPQGDFFGIERFIYEVRDSADNATRTAEVMVEVIPDRDYAQFTYEVFRSDGVTPTNMVEIGDEFVLRVSVQDLRTQFNPPSQRGVFSAYLDLEYDESMLDLVVNPPGSNPHGFSRDVRFSPNYQELVSIDAFLPGLIDEVGATQTNGFDVATQPLGPGPVPFFEARFRATAVGNVQFSGNSPEDPTHQFVFFRPSNLQALDPEFIDFGQFQLTITPPVGAVSDALERNEDLQGPPGSPLTDPILDLLANDVPFTVGRPLTITGLGPNNANTFTTPAGNLLEIVNNGQAVRLTPAPDFNGLDSFTYRVSDGVQSETAEVQLTILPVNDAPVAVDDAFTADNESILTVAPQGVLANDIDIDGDTLTVINFQAVSNLGAQVSVNPNGGFTYNPTNAPALQNLAPGEVRIDSFTYTLSDGAGGQATATVRVFVSRNTGGAHIVEVFAGQDTPNINFGNMVLQGEGEEAVGLIAADVAAVRVGRQS